MAAPGNPIVQLIASGARARGLDPAAVLAVASQEGLSGRIGDGGHAYGPFQLNNAGGVITGTHPAVNDQATQNWANSPAGINFALDRIAQNARGLRGPSAVRAIVSQFERPENPGKEISGALSVYGQYGSTPGGISPLAPSVSNTVGFSAPPRAQGSPGALQRVLSYGNQMFGLPAMPALPQIKMPQAQVPAPAGVGGGAPSSSLPASAPPTAYGKRAVQIASKELGVPYVWGGTSPRGFDCSGLLQYAWKQVGVNIPRTTYDQWQAGTPVDPAHLQPGDAVFFRGSDARVSGGRVLPGHVGIYIGGGKLIEAPHSNSTVRISTLSGRTDYMGARRYG